MIDFTLSDKQKAFRADVARTAAECLRGAREEYTKHADQQSRFRSTLPYYQKLVRAGLLKTQVPSALGGTSDSLVDSALALEELYAVDSSVVVHVIGTGLGLMPILLGGTPEQQKTYLAPFLSGEGQPLASLTHSEPGGTANWLEKGGKGLATTARREGDYYVVNGEKRGWDGKGADISCLCVRYSEDGGPQDPDIDPAKNTMILLVTRDVVAQNPSEAYQVLEEPDLMGHIAASGPLTRYVDFRVPVANVLAPPGEGAAAALVERAFGISAAMVGAMAVATMRNAFEAALQFAREDCRGGTVPVLERQSPADLLISAKIKIDTSRLLVWKALHGQENGPGDETSRYETCLQAKVYCSDQAVQAVWECMQVVGVTAYKQGSGFPRLLDDAAVYSIFDGGNVGLRRRQLQKIMLSKDYKPWGNVW